MFLDSDEKKNDLRKRLLDMPIDGTIKIPYFCACQVWELTREIGVFIAMKREPSSSGLTVSVVRYLAIMKFRKACIQPCEVPWD